MRHRYDTRGIVLSRTPSGETSALLVILTPELGLIRARAQGLRASGAKLAAALATLAESDLALMRGKEGWRVAGAVLVRNRFGELKDADARRAAARVCGLVQRLVAGETPETALYGIVDGFLGALARGREAADAAEVVCALSVLSALGLDDGALPADAFSPDALASVAGARSGYVERINRGIAASGL